MSHSSQRSNFHASLRAAAIALAFLFVLIFSAAPAYAQTYKVLYNFSGGQDGATPMAGVSIDKNGNLYGTTQFGGETGADCYTTGCGTVFRLSPKGSGWIFTSLHIFQGGSDGNQPRARVIAGPDGTFYGTTDRGGLTGCGQGGQYTCGTVFNLRPPATPCKSTLCPWVETVIYAFDGSVDGQGPDSEVAFDQAGKLYSTTVDGGPQGFGTVYQLSYSNGTWSKTTVHHFSGVWPECQQPFAEVTIDSVGNLYGTTGEGGTNNLGCVFQLARSGGGWQENVLHSFTSTEGYYPYVGVILDSQGNLYGSTNNNPSGSGIAYKLTPAMGEWPLTIMLSFNGIELGPHATLVEDSAGNFYGTTAKYWNGNGAVFKLRPNNSGGWDYITMHDFVGGADGQYPYSNVTFDGNRNMYGTTSQGGAYGYGVVWEITP